MTIGGGVVLFVIGAILYFAVNVDVSVVDLDMIGLILMLAGVVVFVLGLVFTLRGRRSVSSTTVDPGTGGRVTRERSSAPGDDRTI